MGLGDVYKRQAYILHKHRSNSYYYALKLRTACYGYCVRWDSRAINIKKIKKLAIEITHSNINCTCEEKTRKKSRDSEKSRSDTSRETYRLRKKQKRQIKKKPTDSGKSRSDKSRKSHRLGKKQKRQIKKKTQILKRGPTREEISNLPSIIRNRKKINPLKKTRNKNLASVALKQARVWLGRRSLFVFDNG